MTTLLREPEQLQIVLDNLISNALKYSAPQSPITITAEIHRVPIELILWGLVFLPLIVLLFYWFDRPVRQRWLWVRCEVTEINRATLRYKQRR